MFRIERLGWAFGAYGRHQFMPPVIAAGFHLDPRTRAAIYNDMLDGRALRILGDVLPAKSVIPKSVILG